MTIGGEQQLSVLLDTHVFLWWITGATRLSAQHRRLIVAPEQTVYVSAVTGWEIALKVKLGKWPDAAALVPELETAIAAEGLEILDVTLSQAKRAGSLELIHRDPFARLLVAQSMSLGIPIATVDPALKLLGAVVV